MSARQRAAIGNQSDGRVFLILETGDFIRDQAAFRSRGVTFRKEPYGWVAVFEDLYGNGWDLIQRRVPDDREAAAAPAQLGVQAP